MGRQATKLQSFKLCFYCFSAYAEKQQRNQVLTIVEKIYKT